AATGELTIRTTISPNAAVGTLREFGIFGGDASALPDSGFLFSHRIHPRIVKTANDSLDRELKVDLSKTGLLDSAAEAIADLLSNQTDASGITVMATGSGKPEWDNNPPAQDSTVDSLTTLLARKRIAWPGQLEYNPRTQTLHVDVDLDFHESAGVLRELGLFGGKKGDSLVAYFVHPPIDKSSPRRLRREVDLALTSDQITEVPDVVGLSVAEATGQVKAAQLFVGHIREVESDASVGRIVETTPPAGERLPAGSPVTLV
ncbi:MAG: PASTA domain-containing protein, partial [bacterium]|nr:PASTA domain-containing protein [bacterium]